MKISCLNLGCKVNQYEIDSIINSLQSTEYEVTNKLEKADIYIVNTCAVTSEAEKKSRQMIARIRKLNDKAKIYVMGCASEHNAKQFLDLDNVQLVIGTVGKGQMPNMLDKSGDLSKPLNLVYEDDLFTKNVRTRAYLKIQDGCNNFCTYCLIPYVRGRSRSRALNSIVKEAESLATTCDEIVLTGINMSDYRIDGELALPTLIRALKHIPARIRISSLEANIVTADFLSSLKELKNFCPHFHLSLQSGSDNVLKTMNRHYTTQTYLEKVQLIRQYFDNPAITTDIIVGFPTETEQDFLDELDFVKQVNFSDVHFFAYSRRPGTVAARFEQLNGKVIKQRESRLKQLVTAQKQAYINSCLNTTHQVLVEELVQGEYTGFTKNYLRVYLDSPSNIINKVVQVKLVEPYKDGVKGILL